MNERIDYFPLTEENGIKVKRFTDNKNIISFLRSLLKKHGGRDSEEQEMNINHFERHINETIVDRGYDYYQAGNIVEVYKLGDYEYIFEVEGNEVYEVIVKVDKTGGILHSDCDCPYDFGPVSKHQVAAYFELVEMLNSKGSEEAKLPEIRKVLNSLSKEELINIIVDISQKDKALRNSLIATYLQNEDMSDLEQYKRILQSIVNRYVGGGGFIAYREVYDFASEMEDLLQRGRDDIDDPIFALDFAFLLLEESMEAFQYADDCVPRKQPGVRKYTGSCAALKMRVDLSQSLYR